MRKEWIVALALAAVLSGCASPRRHMAPRQHAQKEWHSPVEILLRYADAKGNVTRQAMEAGLKRDFAAADTNHDGVLEKDEVRAVNDQRWQEDKSAYSPLVDWNGDGIVDFNEFSETARSLFDDLDADGNGVLTPEELRTAPPGAEEHKAGENGQGAQGHHRGRRHPGGGEDGGQGGDDGGQDGGGNDGD